MKTKKLLTGMLASIIAVSAFAGANVTASAEAFTPTADNFRCVFDFDTVPGTYTVGGPGPGTRKDIVGQDKDHKAVDATNVGYSYTTSIQTEKAQSGQAFRIDVTPAAPEGGLYDPITFYANRGDNIKNNAEGAKYFAFWVDASGFVDPDTQPANTKTSYLYIQETNVDSNGDFTEDATAWDLVQGKDGGYFECQAQGSSDWTQVATGDYSNDTDKNASFAIPAGFVGWIRFDLSKAFKYISWENGESNASFVGKEIQAISFGMGDYLRQQGSVIVFDSFGFIGDFAGPAPIDNTSSVSASTPGATAVSSVAADTSSVESTTSDASSIVSSNTSSKKTNSKTSSKSASGDTENGSSLLWLWIVLGVVVVLAAGGTCFYFFYVKPKNPDFFKNLFHKNKGTDAADTDADKKDDK